MPRFRSFAFAACLAAPVAPRAAWLSLAVEKPFGYAWYDLEHTGPDSAVSGPGRPLIRSRLDFPLDPFRVAAGVNGERRGRDGSARRDAAEAWVSAGPAFFRMRDQDWAGIRNGSATSLLKFSDTYSRAETFQCGGRVSAEIATLGVLAVPFAVGIGAGGGWYYYKLFGLDGRQRNPEANGWTDFSLPDGLRVGTYGTWSAHALATARSLEPLLGLEWELRLEPLIYSGSEDDHILRKKTITMRCLGTGGSLQAGHAIGRWTPYARFGLEKSWGRMRQTYYADSPDSPEDETGTTFGGIRTTVNAWLLACGLRWDLR
jgi:hypothetical protein